MSIDNVINLYPGFHFEGELRMLNRLAAGVNEGVIVAIGSFHGQTDCALALHAQVPVYAIDHRAPSGGDDFPFKDEDRTVWMQNVLSLGLGAKIRPINLDSGQVAAVFEESVGLLFIDGSHDYHSVKMDLALWLPLVLPDGLVALHDTNLEGVAQALAEYENDLELIEEADLTKVFRSKYGYYEHTAADPVVSTVMGPESAVYSPEDEARVLVQGLSAPKHPSRTPKKAPAKKKPAGRK